MKGTTGGFMVGILVGAIAALLAVKLRKEMLPESVDDLAERIQNNLEELDARVQAVVASPN